jgi:hypothetical protein
MIAILALMSILATDDATPFHVDLLEKPPNVHAAIVDNQLVFKGPDNKRLYDYLFSAQMVNFWSNTPKVIEEGNSYETDTPISILVTLAKTKITASWDVPDNGDPVRHQWCQLSLTQDTWTGVCDVELLYSGETYKHRYDNFKSFCLNNHCWRRLINDNVVAVFGTHDLLDDKIDSFLKEQSWRPTQDYVVRVNNIVKRLDDPSNLVRRTAAKEFASLGEEGIAYAERFLLDSQLSVEQRHWIEYCVSAYVLEQN